MPLNNAKGATGAAFRIATLETQVRELRRQLARWRRIAEALAGGGLRAARIYRAEMERENRNKDGGKV